MNTPPHLFISTGEVSGDLQGSLLIAALQRRSQQLQQPLHISALGGPRMAATGAHLLGKTSSIGAVGLMESLRYIWPTLRLQQRARSYLQTHPPDVVVLIDYAGVNLRMGAYLRRHFSAPILYYIAPQTWAINTATKTTQTVVDLADEIIEIFPQAAQYFADQGATVTWVGHPFVDVLHTAPDRQTARARLGISPEQTVVALIPASRYQEMARLLPIMAAAAQQIQAQHATTQFLIPVSMAPFCPLIEQTLQAYGVTATLTTDPHLTLAAADLALTKSGTVNLEAALLGIPQVVLYRLSPISYWVFRHVLRYEVPYISPVNLVLRDMVVPELLQEQATPDRLSTLALELLHRPERRQAVFAAYGRLREALGPLGSLERAADRIFAYL